MTDTLSPASFAIALLIDVRRQVGRVMVMPEAERTTHLFSLHKRLDEAVVTLSAKTARDAATPTKDCQGERQPLKAVQFGGRCND